MKYLLVTLEYPPFKGGISHYYFNLVKNFSEPIAVLDNSGNNLINNNKFIKWWPAVINLKNKIKLNKYNYILVGQILPLGTAAWLLSFILDFKYCVFLHGMDFNLAMATSRKRWLAKKILNKADKIICANSFTEKQVKKIIKTEDLGKVKLVNPGIEAQPIAYDEAKIEALKTKHNLAGKTVLLTVGRLTERKGFDMALEGLNLAKNGLSELFYVIIGHGSGEAKIRQKIANLGLEKNALILTDVDDIEKMHWYKLCDIFIMTARQIGPDVEGFGIVYLEAGLAGKPVIAGNSGGVSDAVVDNVNGLLIDPNNSQEISQAIIKLAGYEKLRQRLGDEGRKRAMTIFNWKGQAEKIYKYINNF